MDLQKVVFVLLRWPLPRLMVVLGILAGGIQTAQPLAAQSTNPEQKATQEELRELLEGLGEPEDPDLPVIPLAQPSPPPAQKVSPFRVILDAQYLGVTNPTFENVQSDSDALWLTTIALEGTPKISQDAQLVATLGASLVRYADNSSLDFNRFNASLGVLWNFDPTSFLRLDAQGQQYNSTNGGEKIFSDVAVQFQLGQNQPLKDKILLSYYYQLRASFADPDSLSRVGNSLNVNLRIPLAEKWQARLGYRFLIDSFSVAERRDFSNQISAEIRYSLADNLSLRGFSTYIHNDSNQKNFTFDSFSYGIGFNASFSLN